MSHVPRPYNKVTTDIVHDRLRANQLTKRQEKKNIEKHFKSNRIRKYKLYFLTYVRIERRYCLISSAYWQGYLTFSYYFIFDKIGDFLPMRTLCDAYHEKFESVFLNVFCPLLSQQV